MKKLQLTFKNAAGKNKNLSFNYVNGDLKPDDAMGYMQRLANLKLFKDDQGNLYDVPVASHIIDTNNQVLFDTRQTTK
jgi:hypothetical protein